MTSALLLIPFFLIRFGLMSALNREAVARAAYFAPLSGRERPAYWVYQVSNGAILIFLLCLRVRTAPSALFFAGAALCLAGLALLAASVADFCAPSESGMHVNGLYRFSRNPMYLAYFVYFLGCALLTQSAALLALVAAFQVSAHWIIRSEERWCVRQFGEAYVQYMGRVRRYL